MASRALVAGCDRYPDVAGANLRGAVSDALAMRDWLLDSTGGGLREDDVLLLASTSERGAEPPRGSVRGEAVLVAVLRAHLKEFETAKEGRVFGSNAGQLSALRRTGARGRKGGSTHSRRSASNRFWPGARTTCGMRASLRWLNAGVPITEVARQVGNSPEVIHRRYHGCIDGHEEAVNAQSAKLLDEDGDAV